MLRATNRLYLSVLFFIPLITTGEVKADESSSQCVEYAITDITTWAKRNKFLKDDRMMDYFELQKRSVKKVKKLLEVIELQNYDSCPEKISDHFEELGSLIGDYIDNHETFKERHLEIKKASRDNEDYHESQQEYGEAMDSLSVFHTEVVMAISRVRRDLVRARENRL